jgi:hypothetical protein
MIDVIVKSLKIHPSPLTPLPPGEGKRVWSLPPGEGINFYEVVMIKEKKD